MNKIYRMDSSGHGTVAQWRPNDNDAIAAGEAEFVKLKGQGFTMYSMAGDTVRKVVNKFDPAIEATLAVPQLRGG